ncbi:molybdopterin-guanine dinucleotide biosynthesis protein MobB [Aliidongia dinghuensis]|uniref:Molybdopterin-guanine dinucleotide biosynthesis protein MobB n=1 Tax=Aliidongia dinghuensis TaxID=1867774 RepID=A0A8J2Z0U7_9PROT|nr:molybdopterin-guanine dinucleotide biosynthesis protein B [Aliidongia dinghuensis]GGF45500.1 molybdopterin-guanine dinucleotide biosynthesis protein MobB [Aliidongia dinghuensis]
MRAFALAGWSGSGKTVLMTRLLPELTGRGITVSTVKHAHHDFDVDQPGKDSWRHRQGGATEVLVASDRRWALMHELRGQPEPGLVELVQHMSPVDLLLVEGFKRHPMPKLEICRPSLGKAPLWAEDGSILAVALDEPLPEDWRNRLRVPIFDLNAVPTIADFILANAAPLALKDGAP